MIKPLDDLMEMPLAEAFALLVDESSPQNSGVAEARQLASQRLMPMMHATKNLARQIFMVGSGSKAQRDLKDTLEEGFAGSLEALNVDVEGLIKDAEARGNKDLATVLKHMALSVRVFRGKHMDALLLESARRNEGGIVHAILEQGLGHDMVRDAIREARKHGAGDSHDAIRSYLVKIGEITRAPAQTQGAEVDMSLDSGR